MMKYFHSKYVLLLILSIFISERSFSVTTFNKISKQLVVVIDPGHGGKDPGAISRGIQEKDVVLGIGLKLGKYISDSYPDVKVIFTRNTDVFVPLIDRSRKANKNKADLFISLHANTCGTPSLRGTETFVLGLSRSNENLDVAKKENSVILKEDNYKETYEGFDPNSSESYIMFEMVQNAYLDQSLSFADDIQQQFKSRMESSNRGVKQAGFLVLRESSMPSVLVETGFVSNQAEANYLKSEEGQRTIALSIMEAFKKFENRNSASSIISKNETKEKSIKVSEKALVESVKDSNQAKIENESKELVNKNKQEVMPQMAVATNKTEPTDKAKTNEIPTNINPESKGYFSIQIGANTTPLDPTPSNFKGLKNVRRDKIDKYYRYYVENENSLENAVALLNKIKIKFPQAFIVSFIDGKRNIINLESK